MAHELITPARRSMAAAAFVLALAGLVGCVGAPLGTVPNSLSSYNRTFDNAVGAMADQKLVFSQQDRRLGLVVGTLDEVGITATLQPLPDGTTRVTFRQVGDAPAGPALLKRVVDAYNERTSHAKILPGGLL